MVDKQDVGVQNFGTAEVLRTPDECFENIPGFPFEPHYLEVTSAHGGPMRMHYVDEGPSDAPVIFMLHGNPDWSYAFRHQITDFSRAGYRVIAPDMLGFGRSDKPVNRYLYSIAQHMDWLRQLIVALELNDITLICQDWGGIIGLGLVARDQERFARVIATNTVLYTVDKKLAERLPPRYSITELNENQVAIGKGLLEWWSASQRVPFLSMSQAMLPLCVRMSDEAAAGYDLPFPEEKYNVAVRQFPMIGPTRPEDEGAVLNRETWRVLENFEKPFLTLWGDSDPTTDSWDAVFQDLVPGAQGQPHVRFEQAGHYLGEDCPEEFSKACLDFVRSTS